MDPHLLAREFSRRKPWFSRLVIDGRDYGGTYDFRPDVRPFECLQAFPRARTILDLGSLEGIQAFCLADSPTVESVLGIEGRVANLEKADFLMRLFHIEKVRFVQGNLEVDDLARYGRFDAVFCAGVLYHLPEPWKLIEQIARVTNNVYVWTHYAPEEEAAVTRGGYRGMLYRELGLADPLSGLSRESFWLSLPELVRMLKSDGFADVRILQDRRETQPGPCVHMTACVPS